MVLILFEGLAAFCSAIHCTTLAGGFSPSPQGSRKIGKPLNLGRDSRGVFVLVLFLVCKAASPSCDVGFPSGLPILLHGHAEVYEAMLYDLYPKSVNLA
jgi:hypothetical protein